MVQKLNCIHPKRIWNVHTIILFLNTVLLLTYGSIVQKCVRHVMCSSRFIFISFHVTRVQFWWRAFISRTGNNRLHTCVSCRKTSKTSRFCFTGFTHTTFAICVWQCIRVTFGTQMSTRTQTFLMFVYENNTYHTHTQYFIHTFHTNTKHKLSFEKNVDNLSLASTFECSRYKTNKSRFRIILVNGFPEIVSYFPKCFGTSRYRYRKITYRTRFEFLYPKLNI